MTASRAQEAADPAVALVALAGAGKPNINNNSSNINSKEDTAEKKKGNNNNSNNKPNQQPTPPPTPQSGTHKAAMGTTPAALEADPEEDFALRAAEEAAQLALRQAEVATLSVQNIVATMQQFPESERVHRAGVHAIGRLAHDAAKLTSQCILAFSAVADAARRFSRSLPMQRLALAALGSIIYLPVIAALLFESGFPLVLEVLLSFPEDTKLLALACEALARLSQHDRLGVLQGCLTAALSHKTSIPFEACCQVISRLAENSICSEGDILSCFRLSQASPDLDGTSERDDDGHGDCPQSQSHRRTRPSRQAYEAYLWNELLRARLLQRLIAEQVVSSGAACQEAPHLLSSQWADLLTRFLEADDVQEQEACSYHADVQALFLQEVIRHFEYEACERSLRLMDRGVTADVRLLEVIRCLVENVEDYQTRLDARELLFDASSKKLVPLDDGTRKRLSAEALDAMEEGLLNVLRLASLSSTAQSRRAVAARTVALRTECGTLLDKKTEIAQLHQERREEFRRETMLFEALEYLELCQLRSQLLPAQVQSAVLMLKSSLESVPSDALERLRLRLSALGGKLPREEREDERRHNDYNDDNSSSRSSNNNNKKNGDDSDKNKEEEKEETQAEAKAVSEAQRERRSLLHDTSDHDHTESEQGDGKEDVKTTTTKATTEAA